MQQYGGMAPPMHMPMHKTSASRFFQMRRHKRMNIAAICVSLFVPWLVFCGAHALQSFSLHYNLPLLCDIFSVTALVVLGVVWAMSFYAKLKASNQALMNQGGADATDLFVGLEQRALGDWYFFILTTCLLGLIFGLSLGKKNFWANTQPYYDLTNLSHYTGVSTATTHGQELMDAGQILFAAGSTVKMQYAIGFRNVDTYCVAPIVPEGGLPQENYDFWAVGLNCCSGGPGDFQCGGSRSGVPSKGGGGLRVMENEDRSFYRLAIQQAQSAFQVRANHPLFFYWVNDPPAKQFSYLQEAMRQFLIAMYGAFGIQLFLVSFVACSISSSGAA